MAKSDEKRLYRVVFLNQGKVYEIFARIVAQGGLFGFVEIEDLVFGEKSMGRGKVVYLVDNPLFRGFWDQGNLLFANALYF